MVSEKLERTSGREQHFRTVAQKKQIRIQSSLSATFRRTEKAVAAWSVQAVPTTGSAAVNSGAVYPAAGGEKERKSSTKVTRSWARTRPCIHFSALQRRPAFIARAFEAYKHRRGNLMDSRGRPIDRTVEFIYDSRSGSCRQNFQALEELDYRSLIIRAQVSEIGLAQLRLTRMRHNGFPNCGELSVMKVIRARPHVP